MLFYDCSTAPSPRRARMFIAEKGIDIESREISIGKGEQLLPKFLALNPRATLPVLVTDSGQFLTENIAISTYLEAIAPENPLMGETADEKAAVTMWNSIAEQQGGLSIADAFRNSNPQMTGRAITGPTNFDQIPELAARGQARVEIFIETIEQQLRKSTYLATDSFTMADITAFVFVEFARIIKMKIPDENTATQNWYAKVKARPSAKI